MADPLTDEQIQDLLKDVNDGRLSLADAIRKLLTKPMVPEKLAQAVEMGMIPKDQLENFAYYRGKCRNATIAMWRADEERFWHLRTKFGDTFAERIEHPEDDRGFDLFVPLEKIS